MKRAKEEVDWSENRYAEVPGDVVGDEKVAFEDEGHIYALIDERGSYTDHIVSASGLFAYWKAYHGSRLTGNDRVISAITKSKGGFGYSGDDQTAIRIQAIYTAYINQVSGPTTYADRRVECMNIYAAQRWTGKGDYVSFVRSTVFESVERFAEGGELTLDPKCPEVARFLSLLGGATDPTFPGIEDERLRTAMIDLATSAELSRVDRAMVGGMYRMAMHAGTYLHAYMEYRLGGNPPAYDEFDLREPSDYEQVDSFVDSMGGSINWKGLEMRMGSFRHKICGSADAIERVAGEGLRVWDWKRSGAWLDTDICADGEQIIHVVNADHTWSSDMIKYVIQLAIYRKLLALQGEAVTSDARLGVFHPALATWILLYIDLDGKMDPPRGRPSWAPTRPISPIEFVDIMFDGREAHLQEILSQYEIPNRG